MSEVKFDNVSECTEKKKCENDSESSEFLSVIIEEGNQTCAPAEKVEVLIDPSDIVQSDEEESPVK